MPSTVAPTTAPSAPPVTSARPARPRWTVGRENRRPGTRAWRLTDPATDHEIEGFADRVSVLPGQPVHLAVSTTAPTWRATAYRMGWYDGAGATRVWQSATQAGAALPAPAIDPSTRMVTAPWRPTLTVATRGWPVGDYLVKLTASTGRQSYVPLVVRSARTAGTVVVMNAPLTWAAYNDWGGHSLYRGPAGYADRSYQVSFDRPYDHGGADKFLVYERPIVAEAERLGLPLSYETDLDVSTDPGLLEGARAVLSLGHDEYWTGAERAAVVAARDAGANLAFFGANEAYWQVRLAPDASGAPDRTVVEYKNAALDPQAADDPQQETARFRDLPQPEPEEQLSGLRYECFPAEGAYVVEDPTFWGFAGTGVSKGSEIPGLVGVEFDRAYPLPATPRPIDVVAHSPVTCHGVPTWSDSAYSTARSGAGTFATGTMHWTCVLAGSCREYGATAASTAFVRQVTDTVLAAFARGPAGRAHPVDHDNLDDLGEPAGNATGGS